MWVTIIRKTTDEMVTKMDVMQSTATVYEPSIEPIGNVAEKSDTTAHVGKQRIPAAHDTPHPILESFPAASLWSNPQRIPSTAGTRSTSM